MLNSIHFTRRQRLLLIFSITAIIFFIQWIFFLARVPNFYDEGIWLETLHKIGFGKKPYVDFETGYGPLYLFYLAKSVNFLGGRLIDMRIVQGVLQGISCFLILLFSLEISLGWITSLGVCTLYAYTVANPLADATMFWAIRYFVGLFLMVFMCKEMLGASNFSRRQRFLLFFLSGPLFYFSGEAAVYCFPAYVTWMFYLKQEKKIPWSELSLYLLAAIFGGGLLAIFLGKIIYLYPWQLFWVLPHTFTSLGLPYPRLSLSTFHFYFPFLILAASVLKVLIEKKQRYAIVASSFALALSLKVALSRSDQAHLSYCYPFAIFNWALLFHWPRKKSYFAKGILFVSLLLAMLSFQTLTELKSYFQQVASLSFHHPYWAKEPTWGTYEKSDQMRILSTSREEIKTVVPENANLYVFPLQVILYSFLSKPITGNENFLVCLVNQNAPECSRTFNFSSPEYVLWAPENSLMSWAFDGYYTSFAFPEAFEALHQNYELMLTSPESGWKVFKKKATSTPLPPYVSPNFQQWEECRFPTTDTAWIDSQNEAFVLEKLSNMKCLKPNASEAARMENSMGIQLSGTDGIDSHKLRWFCKNIGQAGASCSRIRQNKWTWDGLLEPTSEQLKNTAIFIAK